MPEAIVDARQQPLLHASCHGIRDAIEAESVRGFGAMAAHHEKHGHGAA